MSLDLTKFAKPKQVIVPILDGAFQLDKKHYKINCDDGWHLIEITGNNAHAKGLAIALPTDEQKFTYVSGYTHNNTILFQNFDAAKRKWGVNLTAPLEFNMSPTFEAIKAIYWEDGRFYWVEPNYGNISILDIKAAYDQELPITDLKGITPEIRTLYLFHALERDQLKRMLAEKVAKEEHEKRLKDIPYRLKVTFENAGATLLNYSLSGKRIIVDWKINNQRQHYNSVIDADSFKLLECGFCMSGDDRRHNITSMVKTAEEYEERGLTYITRRE